MNESDEPTEAEAVEEALHKAGGRGGVESSVGAEGDAKLVEENDKKLDQLAVATGILETVEEGAESALEVEGSSEAADENGELGKDGNAGSLSMLELV